MLDIIVLPLRLSKPKINWFPLIWCSQSHNYSLFDLAFPRCLWRSRFISPTLQWFLLCDFILYPFHFLQVSIFNFFQKPSTIIFPIIYVHIKLNVLVYVHSHSFLRRCTPLKALETHRLGFFFMIFSVASNHFWLPIGFLTFLLLIKESILFTMRLGLVFNLHHYSIHQFVLAQDGLLLWVALLCARLRVAHFVKIK